MTSHMPKQIKQSRYEQIFLHLRELILAQKFKPGERIPSEAELSQDFGVSRITSRRALSELEHAGLVTRERGRGTRVRENTLGVSALKDASSTMALTNRVIGQSRIIGQSSVRLLTFVRQPPPPHVADRLRLAPGSDIYFIERIRSSDDIPFCYVAAYVPIEIGRMFSPAALESRMMIDLIQDTGHKIAAIEQLVTATVADTALAAHLDTRVGAPMLSMVRTVFDTDERAVEYAEGHFRPDRFRLSVSVDEIASTTENDVFSSATAG